MDGESGLMILQRWEISGGVWHVLHRTSERLVISLRRCDGGEEAERLTSLDPDLLAYIGSRESSED
jgi:hypothetical protein